MVSSTKGRAGYDLLDGDILKVGTIKRIPDFLCDLVEDMSPGHTFNALKELDCRNSRHCNGFLLEVIVQLQKGSACF